MKKRILLSLLLIAIGVSVFAAEVEVTVGDLKYSCDTKTMTAIVLPDAYSNLTKVTIPSSVSYEEKDYTVTEIGDYAFADCEKLRTVAFPNTLKTVQRYAFSGCRNIAKLSLPESLEVIEESAFNGCSMSELIIPEGVTVINHYAFNSNSFLKKVELPSTLTFLGDQVFDNTKLETVISHITEPFDISEDAFRGTSAYLFVPEGLREHYLAAEGWSVFPYIFEGERGEATVNGLNFLFGTKSDIAVLLKGNYSEMEELDIPSPLVIDEKEYLVVEIQERAFSSCKFKEIILPEGVEKIGGSAFSDNNYVTKIVLPSTLKNIGSGAFNKNDHDITPIIVSHMQEPCKVSGYDLGIYMLTDFVEETAVSYGMEYYYPNPILYVPEGTKSAYESAEGWNGCSLIIEGDAFETAYEGFNFVCATSSKEAMLVKGDYDGKSDDEEFKDIVVPQTINIDDVDYTVTVIGEGALSYLYHVNSITIPETVYALCRGALEYSRPSEQFSIPKSLRIIGCNAFHGFEGFKDMNETIVVPEGVEGIGMYAFNLRAETISLPSTLKRVWSNAFGYESGSDIKNIISHMRTPCRIVNTSGWGYANMSYYTLYVPKGSKDDYLQLEDWRSFKEIFEGEMGVTNVDGLKFRWETGNNTAILIEGNYKDMESVTIPETIDVGGEKCVVTKIGKWAFSDCRNLHHVNFPSTLKELEFRAFWECYHLLELNLPAGLEVIDDGAFYGCGRLKRLNLPKGLRSIGNTAFARCDSVEVINLPSTLEKIDFQAFNGINYDILKTVNSHIKYPFPVDTDVFEAGSGLFTNAELHVPKGTLEDYQSYPCWNEFKTIIDDLPEELGDVNEDYMVDVNDFMLIFRYIYGDTSLQVKENDDETDYDFNFHEADMNGDGKVNIADVIMVVNAIMIK